MHRLPPEQFNQHKTCFKAPFHLHPHLFITFPSGNGNIHSQHWIATFHSTRFEQKLIVWKNLPPSWIRIRGHVWIVQGGGACLSLSPSDARIGRIWGSFGETDKCQTSAADKMQALVLTPRGQDKYFYRWICLDETPMHIWSKRKKNMQPVFHTKLCKM